MNDKQSKPESQVARKEIDARRRRPTCEDIIRTQNANLSSRCAKKANLLSSCRSSGCETDDRYPVIISPSDAPLLNTAYNGSGGFLTSGTDSHWEVGLGDPTGPASVPSTSWIKAFVVVNSTLVNPSPPGAWLNSPFNNATWISYFSDGDQTGIQNADGISLNVDAYFRYRFNLGSSVNPATFAVAMSFYADNCVWEIYVNGQPQSGLPNGASVLPQTKIVPPPGNDPYQTSGFGTKGVVQITLDNNWQRCENEIIVYVKSSPGYLGFLAQNAAEVNPDENGNDCHCDCVEVKLPDIYPCISVAWGDSPCDCLETDDVEVACITVCNCYSNVTFNNLSISQILITDMAGNPVPNLPDGTPSIQIIPTGPICFGDIGPCTDSDHPRCVSRELVLYTRGAIGKDYRLVFNGICFNVCHEFQSEQCFIMNLCQD
jgi:hypothetical protein